MRTLYGSKSWKRILALVLVFVMMVSTMGTSGYSVFADDLPETSEEVSVTEPEAVAPEVTEDIQGPSPGEEEMEAVVEADADAEAETSEEDLAEETEETEETEEIVEENAEPVEEAESDAEPVEAPAEDEAPAEEASEPVEPAEPAEETLVAEAAQVILEEAEEVAMPEAHFRGVVDSTVVTVDAPEGAFPEGTEMKLASVEIDTIIDAVSDAVEGNIVKIKAVDITFLCDGDEIQPALPISVKMNAYGMSADSDRQVLHIEESGDAKVLEDADTSKRAVEFEAEHFSVYVIVETGTNARMLVSFVNGSETVASMYVKKDDNMEQVVYDPGVGELGEGVIFKGWTKEKPFTASSSTQTIDEIRDDLKDYDWDTVKDADETGGTKITYYAVFVKQHTITYLDETGVSLGLGYAEYLADAASANIPYTVNMAYTPKDDIHDFQGWFVKTGGSLIDGFDPSANNNNGTIYTNAQTISISGDITFSVNAPEGHWLVFEQNGSGATYCAPQFVLSQENTVLPRPMDEMFRHGYAFTGWYYGVYDEEGKLVKDADGNADLTHAVKFAFGGKLDTKTTVYAKWEPHETAPYTVLLWKQTLDRQSYELAGSYVNEAGVVGQNIPYTFVNNEDEDYVTGVGNDNGHYTGFCLKESSKNQQIKITPEGNAVLNLYYDRIVYNFKFYLYRNGSQNNRYDYANNSGSGSALNDLVTWHTNQDGHPSASGYEIKSETVGGRTYYYFTIQAYYGQDISSLWPTYDKITGANGRQAVSYVMMVGTKLKPKPTNQGSGTVKGIITVMNENILGATNNANGNYVIVRFPDSYYNWRYHIWFETVEGEDYTGKTTHNYNGKTYYEDTVLTVRSSNTEVSSQNEPKYTGFDFKEKRGQNWNNSNYWTTGNNPTLYHLNYVYDRQKFEISYFDGAYINGDNNSVKNRADQLLHESAPIPHGALIPAANINYVPDLPESEEGFVFDGWYLDESCKTPYTWTTMPIEGIKVYAKWRQIQYRVFLHPNAGTDPSLSWGSSNQQMNFRISYGEKVSTPTGTRTGYEFVGWYTDAKFEHLFNKDAFVLNEVTVTTPYDKTKDMTDPMDKWGNGATWNSDTRDEDNNPRNRFWITKKLDLYGKWRKVLDGADGIRVEYDPNNNGAAIIKDSHLYLDNAAATAFPAVTAPEGKVFGYWVMQKYANGAYTDVDGSAIFPGQNFAVLAENAKIVDDPDHENGKIYTVRLRAEFVTPEEPTLTFIPWFYNDGTAAFRVDTVALDDGKETYTLGINKAVDIAKAPEADKVPTRAGYEFLGWAKVGMGATFSEAGTFMNTEANRMQTLTADNLFLYYKDGKFYSDSACSKEAKKVAADEEKMYEALFAVWKAADVTINYAVASDSTGKGSVSLASETVNAISGTPEGSTATAESGYEFDYWTVDNGTDKISEVAKFTPSKNNGAYEAHTYYAHFKEKNYTVTYKVDGVVYGDQENYAYNASVKVRTNPEKTGYTFSGWSSEDVRFPNNEFNMPAGNVTIVGTFAPNRDTKYTVEYYYQAEGAYPDTPTAKDETRTGTTGTEAAVSEEDKNPAKTGYIFDEKAANVLKGTITGDGSLVLKVYFKQQFTVTYKPGKHGTFRDQVTDSLDYNAGTPAAPETTGDPGYVFTGWDPKPAAAVTADATYVAQWAAASDVKYTVEYYYQSKGEYPQTTENKVGRTDGTTGSVVSVTDADKTPAENGYVFDENAQNILSGTVAGDGSLVLKVYFKQQFTVTYTDGVEGETVFADQVTPGIDYNGATPAFKGSTQRDGYRFTGWDKPIAQAVTEDAVYTAQWEKITYAIIYHSNYKSVVPEATEAPDYTDDPATVILGPDATGFSEGSKKTIDGKTYKFVKWTTLADIKDLSENDYRTYTPGAAYNGEGAVLPTANEAGAVNAATNSLRSGLRMAFTSSNGGTLELYAQWEEETTPPDGGGNDPTPNPRPNPDPDPTDDPVEPIDDPDTPLTPGTIDDPDEPIDDPDTPLAPPVIDEDTDEIEEEEIPLTPFTGDDRRTAVWGFLSLLSLAGIVLLGKKRREE